MANDGEDSEELLFEGGVPCLSSGEFVAEEGKRLPVAVREPLKNPGVMSVRGICGEGNVRRLKLNYIKIPLIPLTTNSFTH